MIANPAGISCDGCGFINANRATLTTGQPQMKNGSLTGFRVEGGEIQVTGKGMDASRTDYTDIIARSVKINAGVWAQDLKVTTGRNNVDITHGQTEKKPLMPLRSHRWRWMCPVLVECMPEKFALSVRKRGWVFVTPVILVRRPGRLP
ncbi:filamentous hemagglutinin N-terminal domain-containing protein [Escherichia coli]|nr:filamentous hemagglutinin N-terminal domain-containing protein [Escherichia coli]